MKTPNDTGSATHSGKKTTRGILTKIPGIACLYRHESGRYYAVKKPRSKIKSQALRTKAGLPVTDRKIAESALRAWLERLEATHASASR